MQHMCATYRSFDSKNCSVFLGQWTPESLATMQVRQTMFFQHIAMQGCMVGVSLNSFLKYMKVQSLTQEGIRNRGPYVVSMAEVEGKMLTSEL
ncbi:hypothetical protein CRYUN_Cryun30bG0089100 [Craigia yunnanensis]